MMEHVSKYSKLYMSIVVSLEVGTEENLKRQLDEERRRGERLNQRLLKAEADNARMSKIIGYVVAISNMMG